MNRRSILIPVAVLAAMVAVSPASAADGNGWQCISPFANFTNATYPDDPPAPRDDPRHARDQRLLARTASPLTAVPVRAFRCAT